MADLHAVRDDSGTLTDHADLLAATEAAGRREAEDEPKCRVCGSTDLILVNAENVACGNVDGHPPLIDPLAAWRT
jgi:hypothetical protein